LHCAELVHFGGWQGRKQGEAVRTEALSYLELKAPSIARDQPFVGFCLWKALRSFRKHSAIEGERDICI
jgi:hypothetical protein